MFQLNVVDHIRLSYSHLVQSYEADRLVSSRLARRAWLAKMVVLVLLSAAAAASLAQSLQTASRPAFIVAALTCAAFLGYALYIATDLEPQVQTHQASAARLWLLSEQYRALIAEIEDGLVEIPEMTARRDALIRDVHAVYERASIVVPNPSSSGPRPPITSEGPDHVSRRDVEPG